MVSRKIFEQVCGDRFSFLSAAFDLDRKLRDKERGLEMISCNQVVAVDLSFEARDFYLFVKLVRLQNGKLPPSPGEIRPNTVLHSFDLDDIVGMRSPPSLIPPYEGSTVFDLEFFEQIATTQSKNLREFASDVLEGDFSIFEKLDQVVKDRARSAAFQKWGQRAVEYGWSR